MRLIVLASAVIVSMAADPVSGSWTTGPAMHVGRSEAAVATVNNRIYVIGGYANGNVDQSLVEVLNAASETGRPIDAVWQYAAPLPRGLNHIAAVGYKNRIYTFGGFAAQNNAAVADANAYDPSTNQWSPIAPLPHPLGSVSVAVVDDEIHLVGGRSVHSVGTHLVYDSATNRYMERAPLPVGRDHMGLAAFGGRLFAIGGRVDTAAHNTSFVDVYDPRKDVWKSAAPLPSPRSGMAVAAYQGSIFAIGGERSGDASAFTTNYRYDASANRWAENAPLPQGRHGTGAVVVDNRLFVPGGAPVPGGSRQSDTLLVFVYIVPAPTD